MQLNRFFVLNSTVNKNSAPFLLSSFTEVVTEIEDEVFCVCLRMEKLGGGAIDKAAVRVNLDDIKKLLPYVLFYQAK